MFLAWFKDSKLIISGKLLAKQGSQDLITGFIYGIWPIVFRVGIHYFRYRTNMFYGTHVVYK